ncbi:MAG: hypothetical protein CMI52_00165, partial [Parcubacteria group bacterium]|nr:hypothetical protein [Parcubacteria group bacterium]
MTKSKKIKVLLSGGGTLGPVMPLIAVADEIKKQYSEAELLWIGTFGGVEKIVVRSHSIKFKAMMSVKWRRYKSWKNIRDLLVSPIVLFHAFFILIRFRPDVLVSAGGYVSVPLHIAGWMLRIPSVVHHQDIQTGLANKIMRPFAKRTTATFEHTMKELKEVKSKHTGNPIRTALRLGDRDRGYVHFHLDQDLPTVLIFGGGTGAANLNKVVAQSLPKILEKAQVIHITGQGKQVIAPAIREHNKKIGDRYNTFEFFLDDEMADAYAVADLVIMRAGLSSLSEIAALGKAAILMPIAKSHQVKNAEFFVEKQAAEIVHMSA